MNEEPGFKSYVKHPDGSITYPSLSYLEAERRAERRLKKAEEAIGDNK